MNGPPDALLRTLAAVAPGARVVEVGGGAAQPGAVSEALVRLGFDVWTTDADPDRVGAARARLGPVLGPAADRRVTRAEPGALGFPDAWADWAVVAAPPPGGFGPAFAEAARVLRPGAWVWAGGAADADALDRAAEAAGLLTAAPPEGPGGAVWAVYRRPGGVG